MQRGLRSSPHFDLLPKSDTKGVHYARDNSFHSISCSRARLNQCPEQPTGILERSILFVNPLGCRLLRISQFSSSWIGMQPRKLKHRGRTLKDSQSVATLGAHNIYQTAIASDQLSPSQSASICILSNDLFQTAFHRSIHFSKTSERFSLCWLPSICVLLVAGLKPICSNGWSPAQFTASYAAGNFPASITTA